MGWGLEIQYSKNFSMIIYTVYIYTVYIYIYVIICAYYINIWRAQIVQYYLTKFDPKVV